MEEELHVLTGFRSAAGAAVWPLALCMCACMYVCVNVCMCVCVCAHVCGLAAGAEPATPSPATLQALILMGSMDQQILNKSNMQVEHGCRTASLSHVLQLFCFR